MFENTECAIDIRLLFIIYQVVYTSVFYNNISFAAAYDLLFRV